MFRLNIHNGICICLCYLRPHTGARTQNNVTEYLRRVLLTLVVAYDTYLYLLFVAEVHMIVHLTCDKGVSPLCYSIVEQEVAGTTTDGHLTNRAHQQLVTLCTSHLKALLHQLYKRLGAHWLDKITYYAAAGLYTVDQFPGKKLHVLQPQLFGYFPVDAVAGIVHIGMH